MVLGVASWRMAGNFSPHVGECLAVREGSWFALAYCYQDWIVEVDTLNVYDTVCLLEQRLVEANVIQDICYSFQQVGSGFVCHGSWDGNLVVHFFC